MAPAQSGIAAVLNNVLTNTSKGLMGRVVVANLSSISSTSTTNSSTTLADCDRAGGGANFASGPPDTPTPHGLSVLTAVPVKEVIIILLMLSLWTYSIVLTRKAWYRILKS